jgi:N6-L-threonylcarbamoyladenine synthase
VSLFIGFDTSNYTTSAAIYDDEKDTMYAARKLLDVEPGKIGLRQRDAVFIHTLRISEILKDLYTQTGKVLITACAASEKPREVEGSYMPCFLVGVSHAKAAALTMGVPYYGFTHQQGHLAAGTWSARRIDLLDIPFIALHVSGGTTELLYVEPTNDGLITASRIGGTSDLAAGQLVDRCGQMLGLGFPAGPEIEKLALDRTSEKHFVPKQQGLEFSLSGLENKVKQMLNLKESASNIAYFVIKSITEVLCSAIEKALSIHPGTPVLCAGGVMSNSIIRKEIEKRYNAIFAEPAYASDNAAGIALLAARAFRKGVDIVAAK